MLNAYLVHIYRVNETPFYLSEDTTNRLLPFASKYPEPFIIRTVVGLTRARHVILGNLAVLWCDNWLSRALHVVNMYSSWKNVIRYRINKTPSLDLICMTAKGLFFSTHSKQSEHANNSRGHSKQSRALKSIRDDVFQSFLLSSFGA